MHIRPAPRIFDRFTARGAAFWLVFIDPDQSSAEIRDHIKKFGHVARATVPAIGCRIADLR